MAFHKKFSVLSECSLKKKLRFQKFVDSALEKTPTSCAVNIFGFVADWPCFGSRSIGVARNTGLGVSTKFSSLSRSNAMTHNQAIEPSTQKKLLRFPVKTQPAIWGLWTAFAKIVSNYVRSSSQIWCNVFIYSRLLE